MRAHVIAAGVIAAVLSSGVVSALAARTPSSAARDTLNAGGPTRSEIASLAKTIEALHDRVSALESELARTRASAAVAPTVTAPFTVVNGAGTPIFTVTDGAYAGATKGRVHIGRGSSANYGMWFLTSSGLVAATIGESKTGPGSVIVNKGGKEVASVTEDGFIYAASSGKQVAHLGPDPQNKERARLVVRGIFSITDESGNTTVDAGTLPNGAGAVRTWPNADCARGGLNTCIKGNP
jgi:hypothetical protein